MIAARTVIDDGTADPGIYADANRLLRLAVRRGLNLLDDDHSHESSKSHFLVGVVITGLLITFIVEWEILNGARCDDPVESRSVIVPSGRDN